MRKLKSVLIIIFIKRKITRLIFIPTSQLPTWRPIMTHPRTPHPLINHLPSIHIPLSRQLSMMMEKTSHGSITIKVATINTMIKKRIIFPTNIQRATLNTKMGMRKVTNPTNQASSRLCIIQKITIFSA
jgi:hypothetical protein